MQDRKNEVEAVLFTTGRFMTLEEIGQVCGIGSTGFVKEVLSELKKDYENKDCALELQENEGKWKLGLRRKYVHVTTKLLDDSDMDPSTQKTLAVIAYKNPILQCDLIKIRGNKGYDHIKYLRENGFITSDRHGRTRILKLTQKFFDYFDVAENELTARFGKVVEDVVDKYKKARKGELKKEDLEEPEKNQNEETSNDESQVAKQDIQVSEDDF